MSRRKRVVSLESAYVLPMKKKMERDGQSLYGSCEMTSAQCLPTNLQHSHKTWHRRTCRDKHYIINKIHRQACPLYHEMSAHHSAYSVYTEITLSQFVVYGLPACCTVMEASWSIISVRPSVAPFHRSAVTQPRLLKTTKTTHLHLRQSFSDS